MLNVDLCLVFDIETTFPCCAKTDLLRTDGENQCDGRNGILSDTPCGTYAPGSPREEAADAVNLFAQPRQGRPGFFDDNGPFFDAFASAWNKSTTNGWTNLQPIAVSCVSSSPTASPTGAPSSAPTNKPTDHVSFYDTLSTLYQSKCLMSVYVPLRPFLFKNKANDLTYQKAIRRSNNAETHLKPCAGTGHSPNNVTNQKYI